MKIELTLSEVNTVMQALGQMPYAAVFELVAKIREQATTQVQQQETTND